MTDEELEALLVRTRPRGPSAELHARIVARPVVQAVETFKRVESAPSVWPWAAATAALLIVTLLLQIASAGLRHPVRDANVVAAPDIEDELTAALREAGGLSEDEARLVARVHQVQMRIEQSRPAPERPEP
jgi:hypothetical protein